MTNLRNKIRRMFYSYIPEWFRENAFEIFTSILCVFGGIPVFFGREGSKLLNQQLPHTLVLMYAAILVIAPVAVNLGIMGRWNQLILAEYIFWGRIEAWGLSALAYASYIYAALVLIHAPSGGGIAAGIVLVFGLTCHTRELDIQLDIADQRVGMGLDATPSRR